MPRGPDRSGMTRQQRLEKAFEYFQRGYKNADVARLIKVAPDTVTRYRRLYEEHIQEESVANPKLLTDMLGNTIRVVEDVDDVRADAWKTLKAKPKRPHICQSCGEYCGDTEPIKVSERTALHKVILDADAARMRLFGLLGVKQEYFLHVQKIQMVQAKVLEFIQTSLCEADRLKFAEWMQSELGVQNSDAINTPILASASDRDDYQDTSTE